MYASYCDCCQGGHRTICFRTIAKHSQSRKDLDGQICRKLTLNYFQMDGAGIQQLIGRWLTVWYLSVDVVSVLIRNRVYSMTDWKYAVNFGDIEKSTAVVGGTMHCVRRRRFERRAIFNGRINDVQCNQ